ncbi:S1 family peptidase [Natrononativus amylolyticus]|uniref:S1 family peptidase n=1 Tax=Natrononativus amylolyticus TaxID=2963434 RepID=UPI0020CC3E96|nr:S1 family peptidase [Natrononativus amylolyticus]
MPTTRDYEYLLECANVIGVDYNEAENRVKVFVSQKMPPETLADEDDVKKRVQETDADVTVDVVDAGYDDERAGYEPLSTLEVIPEALEGRGERHRPVPAGVSEINAISTAGTGGPYPARVTADATDEASGAVWSDAVGADDLVRLSNNHVYARSNEADLGEPILQPSPQDGGESDDEVGALVGYVPIDDGVRVDVAARSVDRDRESDRYLELEDEWPTGVRRDGYEELREETVTKTGRTTGVTSATVEATSASVNVDFGEGGTITLRDQLITGYMSEPGDSGSAVFLEDGELVGLLFAGSTEQTICNRIANVEADLGVEILTEEPDDGNGDGGGDREPPVYTTTFERALEVDLEGASLDLESVTFGGRPQPGATVPLRIAVVASEPGSYWVDVDGDRERFEIGGESSDDLGHTVTASAAVPEDAAGTLSVSIAGGRLE